MTSRRPACRRARAGSALITVLAAVVFVVAVATAAAGATVRATTGARLARLRASARLAAEGGVEAARAALARDPGWTRDTLVVGEASVSVVASPAAASSAERVVRAVARVAPSGDSGPAAQVVVEARLRLGPGLPSVLAWTDR